MIDTKYSDFKGIYIAPEAALYLAATLKRDVHIDHPVNPILSRHLIHWLHAGLASPELVNTKGRELLMSFEDLISMRVISILHALGLSWSKIHNAEDWLRERTGYPRPFAVEQVWTETIDIFAEFSVGLVAATRHGQIAFEVMLGKQLKPIAGDMTFVKYDGVNVADSWTPHKNILINPLIQFGEPCIKGTRIRTRAIAELVNGGESIPYIIRSFGLSEDQIIYALEWEDRLQAVKAN